MIDYIIIAVVAFLVIASVFTMIERKKKGKGSCGSCQGCPYSGTCAGKQEGDEK